MATSPTEEALDLVEKLKKMLSPKHVTSTGRVTYLRDMHPSHLLNTILKLAREQTYDRHLQDLAIEATRRRQAGDFAVMPALSGADIGKVVSVALLGMGGEVLYKERV